VNAVSADALDAEISSLAVLALAAGSAATRGDLERELRDAGAREADVLARLRAAGESLGMRVRTVRMTCKDVARGVHRPSLPAVTAGAGVLVVVEGAARGRARLVRAYGARPEVVDATALARLAGAGSTDEEVEWLVADPETSLDSIRDAAHGEISPLRRLLELVKLERDDVWVAVIYSVGVGLLSLATPLGVQFLVNTVAFGALVQPLLVLSTMVLAGLAFAATLRALQSYVVERLQQRVFVRVALDLAHRLPRVRHEALGGRHAPELVNRFFDVMTVQKAAATLLVDGISIVLQTIVGMLLLAFYHPFLLAFDIVLVGVVVFVVFVLGRGATPTALEESKAKYALVAWLQETARHAETFKLQDADDLARARAEELTRDYVAARRKHFAIVFRQFAGALTAQAAASAVLLGVGGWLVIARQLTLGQLVAAELVVTAVVAGFSKLGKYFESFYDLVAAIEKIGQMTDLPVERSDGLRLPSSALGMTLRSTALALDSGPSQHLSSIDLEVRANAVVGICGPSGSGKSALVDAVTGLRSISAGRIDVDGVNLAELAPSPLRRDIAVIRHDSLFAGTIDDNIRLGRREVSRHDARLALERVGAWDAIAALPRGLDTKIGSHGAGLSSDVAKRVAVARAIANRPRLVVLDGIVDGLEPPTREAVRAALLGPERAWSVLITTATPELLSWCDDGYELAEGTLIPLRRGAGTEREVA
jgi:putative ABC transport system ATP-binding protein